MSNPVEVSAEELRGDATIAGAVVGFYFGGKDSTV